MVPEDVYSVREFGSLGDIAYFKTSSAEGQQPVWVFGVNVKNGDIAMKPVELPRGGTCYVNRPRLLCVETSGDYQRSIPVNVWVIDPDAGKVTYTGPTTLGSSVDWPGPDVFLVGDYLVAGVDGDAPQPHGWYGIGATGELTWYVPGNGNSLNLAEPDDLPPPTQRIAEREVGGETTKFIFSAVDGHTTDIPSGRTILFDWGWATELRDASSTGGDMLVMYDNTGNELGKYEPRPGRVLVLTITSEIPVVMEADDYLGKNGNWLVFGRHGQQLAELPETSTTLHVKVLGNKLMYTDNPSSASEKGWLQYDLATGQPGPACTNFSPNSVLGFDGTTLISRWNQYVENGPHGFPAVTPVTTAVDTNTCQTLWTLPTNDVGRVGNTLYRTDDTGMEPLY